MEEKPIEPEGIEDFHDAALLHGTLICTMCNATLDPDEDLGPGIGFKTDGWFIILGDEAYRRGWLIGDDYMATCPTCATRSKQNEPG